MDLLVNKPKGQSRMDKPENLRNWQHWVHKAQDEDKQKKTKTKQNTICVGHNSTQANTNNVNKTRALF